MPSLFRKHTVCVFNMGLWCIFNKLAYSFENISVSIFQVYIFCFLWARTSHLFEICKNISYAEKCMGTDQIFYCGIHIWDTPYYWSCYTVLCCFTISWYPESWYGYQWCSIISVHFVNFQIGKTFITSNERSKYWSWWLVTVCTEDSKWNWKGFSLKILYIRRAKKDASGIQNVFYLKS